MWINGTRITASLSSREIYLTQHFKKVKWNAQMTLFSVPKEMHKLSPIVIKTDLSGLFRQMSDSTAPFNYTNNKTIWSVLQLWRRIVYLWSDFSGVQLDFYKLYHILNFIKSITASSFFFKYLFCFNRLRGRNSLSGTWKKTHEKNSILQRMHFA